MPCDWTPDCPGPASTLQPLIQSPQPAHKDLPIAKRKRTGSNDTPFDKLDPSYHVREKNFFKVGTVFALFFNPFESDLEDPTGYNSSQSYRDLVNPMSDPRNQNRSRSRRFVVIRLKREFFFACPIFTYAGRGTTKRGLIAQEHGIVYPYGKFPLLLPDESGLMEPASDVIMTKGVPTLSTASRINYAICHPMEYSLKVKGIGRLRDDKVPFLIRNWKAIQNRRPDDAAGDEAVQPYEVPHAYKESTTSEESQSDEN